MKLTKQTNNIKSRIVSVLAIVALILCTVLSFVLILPGSSVLAEDVTTTERESNGIKFVQVAAGADFAIGLTYDGKLYGWSLKKETDRIDADKNSTSTLGDYYTTTPTEIKVTFRVGTSSTQTYTWGTTEYKAERTDDSIKSIAATRYTAAFVTQKGYLYTWGRDFRDVASNDNTNYLLLREVNDEYSWKEPYIINYYYYGGPSSSTGRDTNKLPLEQIIPTKSDSFTSLAAGEYNYAFMFIRNYPSGGSFSTSYGDYYHTYVWGSMLYNAVNSEPKTAYDYSASQIGGNSSQNNARRVFSTFITAATTNVSIAAGGYTVAVNNSNYSDTNTSLQLHGRNFVTTQPVTVDGNNITVKNTTQVVPGSITVTSGTDSVNATDGGRAVANISASKKVISGNDESADTITVKDAIVGGNGRSTGDGNLYGWDTAQYYARQKSASGNLAYGISNESIRLLNSDGDAIDVGLAATRYAVSLGNDIGYGISGGINGGKLYGWGDNDAGQLVGVSGGNSDLPTELLSDKTTGTNAVRFISVAAGKQLSNSKAFFNTTATLDGNAFVDAVKNDDKYISAALTNKGTIYAWSKGVVEADVVEAKELYFEGIGKTESDAQKKEDFIAIYSGYGENLFAITASGKLVRITVKDGDFEQYTYDEFNEVVYNEATQKNETKKIDNWTVESTNKVVFTVPKIADDATTEQKISPDLGSATFYVWSAVTSDSEAETKTIQINRKGNEDGTFSSLVKANNIGDAYRIIGLKEDDKEITYLKADNLSDDKESNNYYAPRFYFDGKLMSDKQHENMFEFSPVYNDGVGVGIYIKPLKSSKGKDITVKFYIARYNNYDKYNKDTDNAIYYDYKECVITFSIKDTESVLKYEAYYKDEKGNEYSNIPLLDPNNPYNANYSLAVQDVSTGVDELIKFLTGNKESVNETFKTAVITEMKKDKGFPDNNKIEKGDLTYYLNAEDLKKYNNKADNSTTDNGCVYQFMFADRDGDRIELEEREDGTMNSTKAGAVEGKIETITIKVEYLPGSYGITGVNATTTAENFGATLLKTISTDFDNTYGLYKFEYTTEGGKNYLSFKYDVLTFTAKKATGLIAYKYAEGGSGDDPASVTDYRTATGQPNAGASFISYAHTEYTYTDVAGYVEGGRDKDTRLNRSNVVRVFSLPSLRLKSSLAQSSNGQASGTKNTYVETHNNTQTDPLYVGDTITIKLSDYVDNIDDDNISFSYNEKTDSTSLSGFSNQFKDFTGHGMRVVTLTEKTISVHPTTAAPISFTVEVQRFVNSEKTRYFKSGNNVDEKIYLTFNFNNIIGFNMTAKAQAQTVYTITKSTTIDLFGEGSGVANKDSYIDLVSANGGSLVNNTAAVGAYTELKNNVQIYGLESSEKYKNESEKLFTVTDPQESTDKTKFTITPKRSGSGAIVFSANVYDKSLTFRLTINVSAITELSDSRKISLIDYEYIPVSELDEALRSANSFNSEVTGGVYRILDKDPDGAVYFVDEDGTTGKPPFVDSIAFERPGTANSTLRIKANNSSASQSKTYKMYVRYTNAPDDIEKYSDIPPESSTISTIQIVIPISSGKVKLQSEGVDLVATIDCRDPKNGSSSWLTIEGQKLETHATIELSYLLERDPSIVGADKCSIFLLSAASDAAEYFQYDKGDNDKSIEITPKLNTPENYELSVSVYNDTDKTTKVLTFEVSVKGILTTLPVMTDDDGIIGYGNIWLYSFAIVFGVLLIIFVIRFIVYMRRKAKQRAIIKRNQELIRLRDRMHGKANAATRDQLVKSKLKMDDPKYAKMFNDMRKDKEEESGVTLENSDLAATAEKKSKKKKKKGGKKTVAELKAELEAKKAAFAAAQAGSAQPVNPFATEVPIDGGGFVAPDAGFGAPPDGGFVTPDDGGFVTPDAGFATPDIGGSEIIFDASDIGDGNM